MLHKLLILAGAFLLAGAAILSIMPLQASAQCRVDLPNSSCITCREKQAPVYENGE